MNHWINLLNDKDNYVVIKQQHIKKICEKKMNIIIQSVSWLVSVNI